MKHGRGVVLLPFVYALASRSGPLRASLEGQENFTS